MKTAAFMNMTISEFDKTTPRDFFIYQDGFLQKENLEQKQSIYQAYLISRWVWQKKIDIKKILEAKQEEEIMTDDEMEKMAKKLNKLFGGKEKDLC